MMKNTLSPLRLNELFGGATDETPDGGATFTCERCGFRLPLAYQHEEKPGVCFLDYVSEKDAECIAQAITEAERMFG